MVKKTLLTGALLLSLNSHAKVDTLNEHDSWGGCSSIPGVIERFVLYRGLLAHVTLMIGDTLELVQISKKWIIH
jgi:hypothetical protein